MRGFLKRLLAGGGKAAETLGPPDKMGALARYLQREGKTFDKLIPAGESHALAGRHIKSPIPGGDDIDEWLLHPLEGKAQVGEFTLLPREMPNLGRYAVMSSAEVSGPMRGRGLAQKSYQALADHYGTLMSDQLDTSRAASRVWDKLKAPKLQDEWIGTQDYGEQLDSLMNGVPRRILTGRK